MIWEQSVFSNWTEIGRMLLVGVAAYACLILMLRVSGKRTLSKLNAFDLVITVALGSTFASILTSKDVSLAEGLFALALLVVLQFVVSWSALRWNWIGDAVRAEPAVLLSKGDCIGPVMKRERIAAAEVLAAIRSSGGATFSDAELVVLESDGSITTILKR